MPDEQIALGTELPESSFETGGEPAAEAQVQGSPVMGQSQGAAAAPQDSREVESPTIRSIAQGMGYEIAGDMDEYGALTHLISQAQQARVLAERQKEADLYAQLGRSLAPRAAEINQFLNQPKPAAGPKLHEVPPFDERWAQLLQMDQNTGMYVGKHPNVPQSIVDAANTYSQWTQSFLRNPLPVFESYAAQREQAFKAEITQAVQQALAGERQRQTVMDIARANGDWFYARDEQGNFAIGPNGQYLPTAAGSQYLSLIRTLGERYGISDPVHRDELARAMMAANQMIAGNPNQAAAAQRQRQAQATGRPSRNPLQALAAQERAGNQYATEPDEASMSLRERLERDFQRAGINGDLYAQSEA